MTLTFGGTYPKMMRTKTGVLSLDLAVGGEVGGTVELGLPMRTIVYVFSKHTGIGKSALVFSLAARLSGANKSNPNVGVMPIDTFSRPVAEQIFVHNGADGHVEFIHELRHDDGVSRLNDLLRDNSYCCSILDSLAAYESTSVREGGIEDSNMGRNPYAISQYISQTNGILKSAKTEKLAFITSALRHNMGDRFNANGFHPKGGEAPKDRSAIHIDLNWTYAPSLIAFPGGRLITGEVQKNNFGPTGRVFRVFMVGGYGIHTGMSAAYDAVLFGLASGGKTITDSFVVGGAKLGSPRKLMGLPSDSPEFEPFYSVLRENMAIILGGTITKKSVRAQQAKSNKDLDAVEVVIDEVTGEVIKISDEELLEE